MPTHATSDQRPPSGQIDAVATPSIEPNGAGAKPPAESITPAGLTLRVNPARFAIGLLVLIAVLLFTGIVARTVIYSLAPEFDTAPESSPKLARLMSRFDLGFEPSLPAWYSSLALFWSSALLALIGHASHVRRERFWKHWYGLSALFLLLAIDESVMLHEMLNNTLRDRLQTDGAFYFAWVIPAIGFTACVGIFLLRFLVNLPGRTRWLFLASGALFVGGAVGVEMIEGVLQTRGGLTTHLFTFVQAVEEGLEMIGVVLFLYALLDYINREFGAVSIYFAQDDHSESGAIHHSPAAGTTVP